MANRQRIGIRPLVLGDTWDHPDTSQWCPVDVLALPEERRVQFLSRKRAIELYLEGASDAVLQKETGLKRRNVYRLITARCLGQAKDGTIQGWRGALPHLRIKEYVRQSTPTVNEWGEGAVGSLQWLFSTPKGAEIEAKFREQILGKTRVLEATRRSRQSHFRWFIEELRSHGYEERGEWPFNVERMGYQTICAFIDKVLDENPKRQIEILGGETAKRKAKAGDGVDRPVLRVFERVECDAHKLDCRMVILVPSPHGGFEHRKIHRLWVIVLIEVQSRAVIGYYLSMRKECSAEDVLRAIKRALTLWIPMEIQFSRSAYVPGAGLPSHHAERYLGACWDEFSVDGALANICKRVEQPIQEIVGARVLKPQDPNSYSSRRSLDDRPYIETFFRRLAEGGFHQLSTTTGSSPDMKKGYNPDAAAKETHFQLEYANELLDALIANYNVTPHSGLGSRTPLQQLDMLTLRRSAPLRIAEADAVERMVGVRKLCTLLGGVQTGQRPHFNFANAKYSAEWLCLRTDLIGKTLWVHLENEDDARFASVSTKQGVYLGTIRAAAPWHRTPHTLFVRQSIRSLEKRRLMHISKNCDAVEELIRYAEAAADKKLPAHPAYLEARRVIARHAEALTGQSMVARTRELDAASTPDVEPLTTSAPAVPSDANKQSAPSLPPRRMARQW